MVAEQQSEGMTESTVSSGDTRECCRKRGENCL